MELDNIKIPFAELEKKTKKFRRAAFVTARIGHRVESSEILTFGNNVTQINFPNKLTFENVPSDFVMHIEIHGIELSEKEKLKSIDPNAKFTLWGRLQLGAKDITNSTSRKNYEISKHAPQLPVIFGIIDLRLCGAVPVLCDTIQEGVLEIWNAESRTWNRTFAALRNGKLRACNTMFVP